MPNVNLWLVTLLLASLPAVAQMTKPVPPPAAPAPAPAATLYRDAQFSGPAVRVEGERANLQLNWPVSSVRVHRGRWELCEQANFGGRCVRYGRSVSAIPTAARFVQSARQVSGPPVVDTGWRPIARRNVGDVPDYDITPVLDGQRYREVRVCAERNTVRIRRGDMKLHNGRDQRLFLPLALSPNDCSSAIRVLGGPQGIRHVRFEYETLSAGYGTAEIVVQAR